MIRAFSCFANNSGNYSSDTFAIAPAFQPTWPVRDSNAHNRTPCALLDGHSDDLYRGRAVDGNGYRAVGLIILCLERISAIPDGNSNATQFVSPSLKDYRITLLNGNRNKFKEITLIVPLCL